MIASVNALNLPHTYSHLLPFASRPPQHSKQNRYAYTEMTFRTKDADDPLKIIGTASLDNRSNTDLKEATMSKLTKPKHLTLSIVSICSEFILPRAGSATPAKILRI
ncbi:hypothetical protein GGP41_002526 [Bipolaris sorokiniana]|uniref:Uncharacterized protein n=1 Tax=Cochliobolus sativus TaxID=45130 RepID=A0A8H5ZLC9_COCSA|nr:hypothetical protein GGP41_002526 [Bipolaris sorokiniana]